MRWKKTLTLFCFKLARTKTFLSDTHQPEVYGMWFFHFFEGEKGGGGWGFGVGGGANRLYKSNQALVAS